MRKFCLRAFLAIAAASSLWCLSPLKAYGDTVQLTFTGTGSNTANGGADYAYPYYFDVTHNGVTSQVALMCISIENSISVGESWTADILPATTSSQYEEAAWLFDDAIHNPGNVTRDQDAAWWLFDQNSSLPNAGILSADFDLANAAFLLAGLSSNDPLFSRYQVYIPEGTGILNGQAVGVPQAFMAPTPEPSALLLLGSGMALLAFGLFRYKVTPVGRAAL